MIPSSRLLRFALILDAIGSGAVALMLVAGAGLLAPMLQLPEPFMRTAGVVLIPWVALVAWLGSREIVSKQLIWSVIAGNAAWTIGSLALLATNWIAPSMLGTAFIVAQATAVGIFAELQVMGLRRSEVELSASR